MADEFRFTGNRQIELMGANSALSLTVAAPKDPDVAQALLSDTPFPNRQVDLANLSLQAEGGKDIVFGKEGTGDLSVHFGAKAFSGLGLYPDPAKLQQVLALDSQDELDVDFPAGPDQLYLAMLWGYGFSGKADGSVALGAGSVSFGVDGKKEGTFAVVRRFPQTQGARTAVGHLLGSWILPRQIGAIEDVPPGTWIIAEVEGSIALKLKAQYGYDFNWVREAQLAGLSGDVGLRIQMGVSAALGFSASGRYLVAVSRTSLDSSEQKVRLQLFKLSKRGIDFAFHAGATVQAENKDFLPGEFDEFVKAILGVHGMQVLKNLQAIEQWTDPNQPLPELLADLGVDQAKQLLFPAVGTTEAEVKAGFNKAVSTVAGYLKKWNNLDHEVASLLWGMVEKKKDLTEILQLATKIADFTQEDVKGLFKDLLGDVDFFTTPAGQWLEAAAAGGILRVLDGSKEFLKLREIAAKTAELLDVSTVQGLLGRLRKLVVSSLGLHQLKLDQLEQKLDQASYDEIDDWLRAKLEKFLGEKIHFGNIEKVRRTIHVIIGRRQEFWEKGLKALTKKYEFSFNAAYQKSTTKSALLDVEFDFADPQVGRWLQKASRGDFEEILIQRFDGVSLRQGTLTHEIQRQSHIEVTLPGLQYRADHVNQAFARMNALDEDDTRLLMYELEAKDIVTVRNKRDSRLAVSAQFPVRPTALRVFSTGSMSYSYSYTQATKNMQTGQLRYQLKPYVESYFPEAFQSGNGDTSGDTHTSFDKWISDLDKSIDAIENNGTSNFGNTVFTLEMSLSGAAVAPWFAPPSADENDRRMKLSHTLQDQLRDLMSLYYFMNPDKYEDAAAAYPLLAYAALPVCSGAKLNGNQLQIDTGHSIHWDYRDRPLLRAMLAHERTVSKLARRMERISQLLKDLGRNRDAGYYAPNQIRNVISSVSRWPGEHQLEKLLTFESSFVRSIDGARTKIADLMTTLPASPERALEHLADFGATLTKKFNDIKGLFGGDFLRPLGTMAFLEAARALDPSVAAKPKAVLTLTVYRQAAKFPPPGFPSTDAPDPKDAVIRQRIVQL